LTTAAGYRLQLLDFDYTAAGYRLQLLDIDYSYRILTAAAGHLKLQDIDNTLGYHLLTKDID
jgi:hypothetical protein